MLLYDVYGLRVAVNLELPCLQPVAGDIRSADITVMMGDIPAEVDTGSSIAEKMLYQDPPLGNEPSYLEVVRSRGGQYYRWYYSPGIDFVINRECSLVWCKWKHAGLQDHAIISLTGAVLGFILRMRGNVCLHASGIVCEEQAFALCGVSGAGKSSLAAAFATSGFRILTDDIMPLSYRDGVLMATPGYPRINLYPDSHKYIEGLPPELPLLSADWDKCYLDLLAAPDRYCNYPVELKAIYIIDWQNQNPANQIQTLSPSRAVSLLAANTYYCELLDATRKKDEFIFLSRVVNDISIKQLQPVSNIRMIQDLKDKILENFSAIAA